MGESISKEEKVARILAAQNGYNPHSLEPGDMPCIDGYMPNGDPAHYIWRQFANNAEEILWALHRDLK